MIMPADRLIGRPHGPAPLPGRMLALYVAMSAGPSSPETSAAFTTAPVVALYSPIVLLPRFTTNRSAPAAAMPNGKLNPETSAAFTTAPVVALYSPIVLLKAFVTKITSARGGDRQRAEQDGKQRAQPAPQPQLHFLSLTRRLLRRFSTDTVARIAPLTNRIKGPEGLFSTRLSRPRWATANGRIGAICDIQNQTLEQIGLF